MLFRNNWIKALIINIIIFALIMIFTDMAYETNDDYAIAGRIVFGDPFAGYVSYFLCLPMIGLQQLLPSVNIFVGAQMLTSFFAFVCFTKLILDQGRGFLFDLMMVLIVCVYSFDHYSVIQFTKTAGLLTVVGLILICDAIIHRKNAGGYIWGFILLYLGAAFRFEMIAFSVGFAGLYLLFWGVRNRRALLPEGYLTPKKVAGYVICLILLAGTAGMYVLSNDQNKGTEELAEYNAYNDYRSAVLDYSIYDHYKEHPEAYEDVGITKNDFFLINSWYLDFDGAASEENLAKVTEIYGQAHHGGSASAAGPAKKFVKNTIKDIRNMSMPGIHIAILLILALLAIVRLRPGYWIYVLALGAAAVCLYLFLYYLGRPAYRTSYIIDLAATFWLLYYIDPERYRAGRNGAPEAGIPTRAAAVLVTICVMVAAAAGCWTGYERGISKHDSIASQIRPSALTERIAKDTDHTYVFSTRQKKNLSSYADPLRAPEADANVLTFGSWGTKSPYIQEKMKARDLNNVFGDIIDNESVYVIEGRNKDRMEEYFTRWYGDENTQICYESAGEVDGYELWQVVRRSR